MTYTFLGSISSTLFVLLHTLQYHRLLTDIDTGISENELCLIYEVLALSRM